jgi:hypothetical protein
VNKETPEEYLAKNARILPIPFDERNPPPNQAPPIGEPIGEGVERSDFQAFMPGHAYIFVPTGELWPGSSVNSRIPPIEDGVDKEGKPKFISASAWLDRNRPVEQMTWAPGMPKVISDRLISDGGWIERKGVACFNLYRGPTPRPNTRARRCDKGGAVDRAPSSRLPGRR